MRQNSCSQGNMELSWGEFERSFRSGRGEAVYRTLFEGYTSAWINPTLLTMTFSGTVITSRRYPMIDAAICAANIVSPVGRKTYRVHQGQMTLTRYHVSVRPFIASSLSM